MSIGQLRALSGKADPVEPDIDDLPAPKKKSGKIRRGVLAKLMPRGDQREQGY